MHEKGSFRYNFPSIQKYSRIIASWKANILLIDKTEYHEVGICISNTKILLERSISTVNPLHLLHGFLSGTKNLFNLNSKVWNNEYIFMLAHTPFKMYYDKYHYH